MNNKGFTLIEAVVALAIFIAISSVLAQIVFVSIQNQIKVTLTQNMFNQAIFSLDKIEKELRMAKKDRLGTCITAEKNYAVSGSSITFLYNNQETGDYVCKKFELSDGKIKEHISTNDTSADLPATGVDITASSINIDALQFNVVNDGVDTLQPKITITMTITSSSLENQTPIKLQTTISQRRIDL